MDTLLIYLLKVSLTLALLVCFYQLALRRLTFHQANRIFLLAAMLLPFFIPLINLDFSQGGTAGYEPVIIRWMPATETVTSKFTAVAPAQVQQSGPGFYQWLAMAWGAGVLLLLVRLGLSMLSLARLLRRSAVHSINGIETRSVPGSIAPFSFGNKIFLPAGITDREGLTEILSHELVHVRQWHTADILLSELLCIVQWFNPFAWIMRKAVRQNLEFIADHHVISTGVGRQEYQLLLLSVMGRRSYGMTSQFNLSSLKNRISMMNKNSNSRKQLLRFVILFPLAALLLLSFRKLRLSEAAPASILYRAVVMDIGSRQPVEGVALVDTKSGRKAVTNSKGIVELKFAAEGKLDMQLEYTRDGYTRMTSTLSFKAKKPDDGEIILSELVGIRKAAAGDQCGDCFTSLFMEEHDLLENPRKALDQHLENRSRGPAAVARINSTNPVNGSAKAVINKSANTVTVSGNSVRLEANEGEVVYNNAIVKPRGDLSGTLVVLNGQEMEWKAFKALSDSMQKVNQHMSADISEIRMLNAADAKSIYGEKGANGAVIITGKVRGN